MLVHLTKPLTREEIQDNFISRIKELTDKVKHLDKKIKYVDPNGHFLGAMEHKHIVNQIAHYEQMLWLNEYLYKKMFRPQ